MYNGKQWNTPDLNLKSVGTAQMHVSEVYHFTPNSILEELKTLQD